MEQGSTVTSRIRISTLLAMIVVAIVGVLAKTYQGPAAVWVNHYGPASMAYEVFFMLFAFLLVPRRSAIVPIAVIVCVATHVLEFAQLWQPPWLQTARDTLLGRTLLGNDFSWWDFPAYFIGCGLGILLLLVLCRMEDKWASRSQCSEPSRTTTKNTKRHLDDNDDRTREV